MIRQINSILNNIAIRKKIVLMLLMGIVLPISVIVVLFSLELSKEAAIKESQLINSGIQRVQINLTGVINVGESLSLSYFADERFNELIGPLSSDNIEKDYPLELQHEVNNKINKDLFSYALFSDFRIYHTIEAFSTGVLADHISYLSEEEKAARWYGDITASGKDVMITTADVKDGITIIRRMNFYDYDSDLLSALKIEPKVLQEAMQDSIFDDNGVEVFLLDGDSNVIMSNGESDVLPDKASFSEKVTMDFEYPGFINDWRLVAFYDDELLSAGMTMEIVWLVLPMMVVMVVSVILFHYIGHSISNRLRSINNTISSGRDSDLKLIDIVGSRDEIGVMASHYNYMVRRVTALIREVTEAKDESDRLLKDKTTAYEELSEINSQLAVSNEEIRQQDLKIKDLIYKDSITGLDNRTSIIQKIEFALKKVSNGEKVAVAFIDVDNFKYINDTFGHDVGDRVIELTGKKFAMHINDKVTVGRFGGDEFLVLVEHIQEADITGYVEHIKSVFEEPIVFDDHRFYLTVSIGISVYPKDGGNVETLVRCADMALYKAKEEGRNLYFYYNQEMMNKLEEKSKIQKAIKSALINDAFVLHYQPIFKSFTGEVAGFEALIRWNSDEIGNVSPYQLIRVAEETGLITELGKWIFKEACIFIGAFNKSRVNPVKVSVNISAVQITEQDFVGDIMRIVNETGVDPEIIDLEMTETVLIDVVNKGVNIFETLVGKGFAIALDDFGTGYSSLSYFNELPLAKLKIDKSFIDKILEDSNTKQLVESMIKLAHNRSIKVISEGVETESQYELLRTMGCDLIQGYYMSKPKSEEEVRNSYI